MKRKIIASICAACVLIPAMLPVLHVNAEYKESDLINAVNDAIKWKDSNDSPFYSIGTDSSNSYITALRQLGKSYDYASYLNGLDGVAAGYSDIHNASDMAKTAIAAAAAGGDAQNVGGRDLIADSTYYRDAIAPLDKEGANGYSWALIALDSKDYPIPEWGMQNRNTIISGLLSHQNTDGSFDGDIYATASAVAALAPYVSTSGAYTVTQNQTGWTFDLSPADACDAALTYLSDEQEKDGSWSDLKSTAMVVTALDAMNVDADKDSRFVARQGSAIDGLMSFKLSDGGFAMSGGKSDGEATAYAVSALTSHLRKLQGKTRLYYMNRGDVVTLTTPAPAAESGTTRSQSSSSSSGSSSSSSSNSSSSSSSSSSSGAARATTRPATTVKPVTTMQPTKTTTPRGASEAITPRPVQPATPKPAKRSALVGPVEMPGPMKPTDPPEDDDLQGNSASGNTSVPVTPIVAAIAVLVILAIITALILLKKSGTLDAIISGKSGDSEIYKAKRHRKTEEHRKYEQREKYKERLKFKK